MRTVVVTIRRLTTAAVLLIAVAALLVSVALRTDTLRVSRVLTGSMDPAVPPGALVASRPADADALAPGDVVMFMPPEPFGAPGGAPVVHRVVDVAREGGDVLIHTKGDANAAPDPWTVNASKSTVFRVAWASPAAGRVADTASRGGMSVGLSVVVVFAAARVLASLWRRDNTPKHRLEPAGSR